MAPLVKISNYNDFYYVILKFSVNMYVLMIKDFSYDKIKTNK